MKQKIEDEIEKKLQGHPIIYLKKLLEKEIVKENENTTVKTSN